MSVWTDHKRAVGSVTCGVALLAWAASAFGLGLAADATGPSPPSAGAATRIAFEGVAEPMLSKDALCTIHINRMHVPVVHTMVPEWAPVEEGDAIVLLDAPYLMEERSISQHQLQVLDAKSQKVGADASAAFARLRAECSTARMRVQQANDRLALLKAMPTDEDQRLAKLHLESNEARCRFAELRLGILSESQEAGVCSDRDMTDAQRETLRLASHSDCLRQVLQEVEGEGASFAARQAALEAQRAALDLEIAEVRYEVETQRRHVLCEVAQLEELAQATKQLAVLERKVEALTIRAPAPGRVRHGDNWDVAYGLGTDGRVSPGTPVYGGQPVASVVGGDGLRVRAEVAEQDLLAITRGDEAEVRFRAIPGLTCKGEVETVLPVVRASRLAHPETGGGGGTPCGTVIIVVRDAGARARPGMAAVGWISPASGGPDREAGSTGASRGRPGISRSADDASSLRPDAIVLSGLLAGESERAVTAPFSGRVTEVVEEGTLVQAGDVVARVEAGLEEDWRSEDESELRRLTGLLRAAELEQQLRDQSAPLLRRAAETDVALQELALERVTSRPLASERIRAENELVESQRELQDDCDRLAASRDMLGPGLISAVDVEQRELAEAVSAAHEVAASAALARVARGAPAVEIAVAEANLKRARTELQQVDARVQADTRVAAAQAKVAAARLAAFRREVDRHRQRAALAVVKSPATGIVCDLYVQQGEEVQAGWWLMRVAQMERGCVHAMMDESGFFRLAIGDRASVRLAALPDEVFHGRVSAITDWLGTPPWYRPGADSLKGRAGRLFRATVELEEDPPICIGMSAVVEILPTADSRVPHRSDRPEPAAQTSRSPAAQGEVGGLSPASRTR